MKKLKVLSLLAVASGSMLLGWGWVNWKHEKDQATAFEARQSVFLSQEYERLRAEVLKSDAGAQIPEAPGKEAKSSEWEAAIAPLRSQLVQAQESAREADEIRLTKEIEEATVRIRGLEFKEPVSYNVLDRSQIGPLIEQKIGEQYTDEELEQMVAGYAAIGLLPENFPLKQTYVELLGEQIAAFYDQHTHKLFMFRGSSLKQAQNRVILTHELTHALQDQHFTLKNLPLELKDNDDRVLATASLVEGDATLEMNLYMLENLDGKSAWQSVSAMLTQNMEKLYAVPRILRESLLFPYLEGAKFCTALQMRGPGNGFEPINKAFKRVPSSTTQILHPEKYWAKEEPITIGWDAAEWKGEKPVFDNVMGEFATRILLSEWGQEADATRAAEGWRGDRYLIFRNGAVLVWQTLWSDLGEAEEFAESARAMLSHRYGVEASSRGNHTFCWEAGERTVMLSTILKDAGVILVHAASEKECEELLAQFTFSPSAPAPAAAAQAQAQYSRTSR